jgi:hypothetical protein
MQAKDWQPDDKLAKLDPILKKIRAEGTKALTEGEMNTLNAASTYLKGLKKVA